MDETIEVDSQIDKGSVIRITLPLQIDQVRNACSTEKEQSVRGDIAGMRVLLAEDNELNCEIVEFMLKEAGAEAVTANGGKAAHESVEALAAPSDKCRAQAVPMPDPPNPDG